MRRIAPVFAVLLVAGLTPVIVPATLSAQPASYTYINQKAPYSNPGSMLTVLTLPKVGTTFKVQVPNGASWWIPSPYYYLAFGVSNPDVSVPLLKGWLFTSAEVLLLVPYKWPVGGTVTMSFPIPNSPHLVGTRFYQQVLMVFPGEFVPPTYRLSRGALGVIGT